MPSGAHIQAHRRILLVVTRAQQAAPGDTVEHAVMERSTEAGPPTRWSNRQLDELKVPAYPFASDIGRKRLIREIRPVLPTLSDVTPAEPHHRADIEGYGETETLASGVALEEVRAPHLVVVEVTEDSVVARPDLIGESRGIRTGNQLEVRHWRCRSAVSVRSIA